MSARVEKGHAGRKDPLHCAHVSIRRIANAYECTGCGTEFVPKNPRHATKWENDFDVWVPNATELKQLQGKT